MSNVYGENGMYVEKISLDEIVSSVDNMKIMTVMLADNLVKRFVAGVLASRQFNLWSVCMMYTWLKDRDPQEDWSIDEALRHVGYEGGAFEFSGMEDRDEFEGLFSLPMYKEFFIDKIKEISDFLKYNDSNLSNFRDLLGEILGCQWVQSEEDASLASSM